MKLFAYLAVPTHWLEGRQISWAVQRRKETCSRCCGCSTQMPPACDISVHVAWFPTASIQDSLSEGFLITGALSAHTHGRPEMLENEHFPGATLNQWLPLLQWKNSELYILHWLPEFPRGIELQLPTVVTCSITHSPLASFLPCLTSPVPEWWSLNDCFSIKPLALESLSQVLLLEDAN